jgi:aldehyde dehydrogenase (NAD+)
LGNDAAIVQHETFAPILYVMKFRDLDDAIAMQNAVPQGLSSAIFTQNLKAAEAVPRGFGFGLRHCQRQHRHLGRGNRRRVRWREGNRRRARVRFGCVEGLHAPPDQYHQLLRCLPLAQGIKFDL